jgi:hypothetical protein
MPSEDDSTSSNGGGGLWLSYPLGVQHGDLGHPNRDYAATRRNPGSLDYTSRSTAGAAPPLGTRPVTGPPPPDQEDQQCAL